jgi:hypothetical protein
MALSDEAKAEMREAMRIIHEDRFLSALGKRLNPEPPPADNPDAPPKPPPAVDPKPSQADKPKRGAWWAAPDEDGKPAEPPKVDAQ